MTAPIVSLTTVIGYASPDGRGTRNRLRKSAVQGLAVVPYQVGSWSEDGLSFYGYIGERFAVMAVTSSGLAARVGDHDTESSAQTQVVNDPQGVLA